MSVNPSFYYSSEILEAGSLYYVESLFSSQFGAMAVQGLHESCLQAVSQCHVGLVYSLIQP